MKHSKIVPILLIISIVILYGCDKCNFEGVLEIKAESRMNTIRIYTLEDSNSPIYNQSVDNKKYYSIKINAGNYKVNGYSEDGYLHSTTLQVRPDRTTVVYYDEDNNGEVQY